MRNKVLTNAIWNVVNGTSSAVVAVVVPPFLTRLLTPEAYGAWALALQIGTYVGLFGFGIQMAVGRYVAYHEARGDIAARDGIVATSFWFLAFVSLPAWIIICLLAARIGDVLPHLSVALVPQTQVAIALVGLSLAINLPASVFAAVFTGRQQSDVPAKIQGVGRIALAVGIIVAGLSRNLAVMAAAYTLVSVLTIFALWFAWRYRTGTPTLARHHISWKQGKELFGFCFSLTLWNLSMLLISGLDLLIVGRFDYKATPFFAVSVTLMTLLSGTLSSLANALVPAAAGLVDDTGTQLWALVVRSSRLIVAFSILSGSLLICAGDVLLRLWLGSVYAVHAWPILSMLVTAVMIRNAMVSYVTIAIGLGYQRKMFLTPLIEGAVSLGGSVMLASSMGARGVAFAKIIGGVVGAALLIGQHALRAPLGGVGRARFFSVCVARPFLSLVPIAIVGVLVQPLTIGAGIPKLALMGFAAILSVWWLTLTAEDRADVTQLVMSRLRKRPSTSLG